MRKHFADHILEISTQAHLWAPLVLLAVLILAALTRSRKLKYVMTASLGAAAIAGWIGVAFESLPPLNIGTFQVAPALFIFCFWTTIGFCAFWPLLSQVMGGANARLFFTQAPLCFAGFAFLVIFAADRWVAQPVFAANRVFWRDVVENQKVGLEMQVYKANLTSAAKAELARYLLENDPHSLPVLHLLDDFGIDVSREPHLDGALFKELRSRAERNQQMYPKDSPAGKSLYLSLASNPAAPPDLLEELSRNEDVEVVVAVARNPHAPAALLFGMAERARTLRDLELAKPARERNAFSLAMHRRVLDLVDYQRRVRGLQGQEPVGSDALEQTADAAPPSPELLKAEPAVASP